MTTPSDVVSMLQRTLDDMDPSTVWPSSYVPELDYHERDQVKGMLLYLREAADDLGCANPHEAPLPTLIGQLDARAHGHSDPPAPFTPGELDTVTGALGGLAGLLEGIGDPRVVKELRRLRLRAANMYVQEVGSDA